MRKLWMLPVVALVVALAITNGIAQPTTGGTAPQSEADKTKGLPDKEKTTKENGKGTKSESDKGAGGKAPGDKSKTGRSYLGWFQTEVLAGEGNNDLRLPFPSSLLTKLPTGTITWEKPAAWWLNRFCPRGEWPERETLQTASKKADPAKPDETLVTFVIPPPRCWLPYTQTASIKIDGEIAETDPTLSGVKTLFEGRVPITVFWLPLAIALLTIGLIYPGCALVYAYMRRRNYERSNDSEAPAPPTFLASLDPVQITANPYGRASLGKLQIFMFTLIVFGLLLYHLLRSGVLATMSTDVMLLLGISAVGAVGSKVVLMRNRRLSYENWSWLVRHGWLPKKGNRDVAPRAKWSELFLDSDTDEFDIYSFQMAVFSLVVAAALARTSLSGLGTFTIPEQLLVLLGLSQGVFVAGKSMDNAGYRELNDKLTEVRLHERKVAIELEKTDRKQEILDTARIDLVESTAQAAQMFAVTYEKQLPEGIPKVVEEEANKGTRIAGAG